MIYRYAERRADSILTTVSLANGIFLFVVRIEVELEIVYNLAGLLWQPVFLHKWQYGALHRCKCFRQLQHHARLSILQRFLGIGMTHHAEEHAVYTDRGFD